MAPSGNRLLRPTLESLIVLTLIVVIFILAAVATDSKIRSRFPDDDMGKDSLPARKKAQFEAA